MSRVFITYADDKYIVSAQRIAAQAKRSKLFGKVKIYTPKDLPSCILNSPVMAFTLGGGYWLWKSYVIMHALSDAKIGDVIYYADAGCTLNTDSPEWNIYDKLMREHDAILFQYRNSHDYGWKDLNVNSVKLRHWIKPLARKYFSDIIGSESYLDFDSIWAGFCIVKKTGCWDKTTLIYQWLSVQLFHPELLVNPLAEEIPVLPDDFNLHRHDQTILSALTYLLKDKERICILPETAESRQDTAAIAATRWRQGKLSTTARLKWKIYNFLHKQ